MKYVVEVKHDVSGIKTGFNLKLVGDSDTVGTNWLKKLKDIMEVDFSGFHITNITFEEKG